MADLRNMIEKLKGDVTGQGNRGRFVPNVDQALKMSDGPMSDIEKEMMRENYPYLMEGDGATYEPRFEDRPPNLQMFSIEGSIENLYKEYEIAVRSKDYERAQAIANEMSKLDEQKIQIQTNKANQDRAMERTTGAGPRTDGKNMGGIMRLNQGGELQRAEPINMVQPLPIQGDPFASKRRENLFGRMDNSAMGALAPVGNFIRNRIGVNDIQPTLQQFASTIDQKFPAKQGGGIGSIGIGGGFRPPSLQPFPHVQPLPSPISAKPISQPLPNVPQPVQQIQGFAEGGATHTMEDGTQMPGANHAEYERMMQEQGGEQEMSSEQAMGEFEMSKQELMNELFIPLAENGYEKEVMAILQNPIDSEESTNAQRILSEVLSQEADFNINDFLLAVSMVAPQ